METAEASNDLSKTDGCFTLHHQLILVSFYFLLINIIELSKLLIFFHVLVLDLYNYSQFSKMKAEWNHIRHSGN